MVLSRAYPPLQDCGGFQLLLSKEKRRNELRVVCHGTCTPEEIRCLGSGRIYIRPLQRNIPLSPAPEIKEEYEECLTCLLSVPVSQMREHREVCAVSTSLSFLCMTILISYAWYSIYCKLATNVTRTFPTLKQSLIVVHVHNCLGGWSILKWWGNGRTQTRPGFAEVYIYIYIYMYLYAHTQTLNCYLRNIQCGRPCL